MKLNSYIYFFIIKFGVLNWSHWEKRNDNNRGTSWIVVVNIQSSRWGRREEYKIKQLWGTLRSHQCVSQAGTGCCRSAERHRFCRERKSVSLAMPQINLLALPNLSSPYSLRHSTMCKEACICLQRPAMFQKFENEMAGFRFRNQSFFSLNVPCEKQNHHHLCQWPLRRLSWISHKSLWTHKPIVQSKPCLL